MKKDSIGIENGKGDWEGRKLTIGMDLGDRLGNNGDYDGPDETNGTLGLTFWIGHRSMRPVLEAN